MANLAQLITSVHASNLRPRPSCRGEPLICGGLAPNSNADSGSGACRGQAGDVASLTFSHATFDITCSRYAVIITISIGGSPDDPLTLTVFVSPPRVTVTIVSCTSKVLT